MFDEVFKELSKDDQVTYINRSFNVNGFQGARVPISIYYLTINVGGHLLELRYDFGNHNIAEIELAVKTDVRVPEISIETRSHLQRLLSSKKNIWNIRCKNKTVKTLINEMLDESGLTSTAENEAFEPNVKSEYKNSTFYLKTFHSLGFNYKEKSIKPIIEFHKKVIEFIVHNYCK